MMISLLISFGILCISAIIIIIMINKKNKFDKKQFKKGEEKLGNKSKICLKPLIESKQSLPFI